MQASAEPDDGRSDWLQGCRRFSGAPAVHRADHEQQAPWTFRRLIDDPKPLKTVRIALR
jgi:hypothetical protein